MSPLESTIAKPKHIPWPATFGPEDRNYVNDGLLSGQASANDLFGRGRPGAVHYMCAEHKKMLAEYLADPDPRQKTAVAEMPAQAEPVPEFSVSFA
jgi:hypothetical protein